MCLIRMVHLCRSFLRFFQNPFCMMQVIKAVDFCDIDQVRGRSRPSDPDSFYGPAYGMRNSRNRCNSLVYQIYYTCIYFNKITLYYQAINSRRIWRIIVLLASSSGASFCSSASGLLLPSIPASPADAFARFFAVF